MPLPFEPEKLDAILAGEKPPPIPWLIEGLLPQDSLLCWAADPGVGKSFLALDLAIAVATGQPFLGLACKHPGPVVFFDEENPKHIMAERVYKLAHGRGVTTLDGRLFIFRLKMRGRGLGEWSQDALAVSKELHPVLFIFDTLLKFSGVPAKGKENDASLMQAVCDSIHRCKRASSMSTALFLHHLNKNHEAKSPRGSTIIMGDPDGIWTLTHCAGHPPTDRSLRPTRLTPDKARPLDGASTMTVKPQRSGSGIVLLGEPG
jgi:RecA-family ATPase